MPGDLFNRISPDELTIYFVGAVILIVIPPLVGLLASRILFGSQLEGGRTFWQRLLVVLALCVLLAGGLGFAGVYLLEPASPQAVWLTLGIAFVFGLLGAGKLYWEDDALES